MPDLVSEWSSDHFRTEVQAWLDERLPPVGLTRQGPLLPVRVRFWSAVFQVAVSGRGHRQVWVKVGNPGQAFEGPLLQSLERIAAEQVVGPLVVDECRGWWVLPDGGPTLQEAAPRDRSLFWGELLEQAARLQRHLAPRRAELKAVPGLPLEAVVPEVERHLAVLASLAPGHPQHLSQGELGKARAGLPRLAAAVRTLAGTGVPDTLQPNDISLGNAVDPPAPGGPYRLFDLGDALWSHPFGVLHLSLRLAAGTSLAGTLPGTPQVRMLAMRYLRCWPEVPERLGLDVLDAADRLGSVHRALSWARLLAHVDTASVHSPPRVATWLGQALAEH